MNRWTRRIILYIVSTAITQALMVLKVSPYIIGAVSIVL